MPNPTMTSPMLVLDFGGDNDNPCGLCGNAVDGPSDDFGVAIHNGPRVCQNCAHKHEPGAWQLAEGLDHIEHALRWANPKHRPGMVAAVISTIRRMSEEYREADQEKAGYAEAIRDAGDELGVSPADMRGMSWTELFDGLSVRYRRKSMGVAGKQAPDAKELQDVAELLAHAADNERGKS